MIVSIGDIHLSSLRPWSVQVGRRVVEDLIASPLNNPSNTLVLLGDLTELAVLDGAVYSMLLTLFMGLRYKRVIILRGNHDGKVVDGKVFATFDFIRDGIMKKVGPFSTIEVVEKPYTLLMIEEMSCLFLPHLFGETESLNLDVYETRREDIAQAPVDIIFGHFTNHMRSEPGKKYNVEWMEKAWPQAYWCFGHNHNPSRGYQGSHIPNTITEANKDREIRTYSWGAKGPVENILPAPRILDYYTVTFPDPLPEVDAEIPVWTIANCTDEHIARQQYGDIFIRRCLYDLALDSASFDRAALAITNQAGETIGIKEMADLWLKTMKLDPEVEKDFRSYLPLAIN